MFNHLFNPFLKEMLICSGLVSLKSKAWVESPFHIIRFHSRSSEPIDLSPGGKLQELQTERSEKERVVNEKSLAWPARKKDQHSRLLDKSVIRRIASRGGRPFSMLIEKSISELKGLVWPEVHSPFGFRSESLLLLSNKAQVTAGSFYYEMVHLYLFIGNFLKNWTCCFTPTQDESHSVSPPKPIPNWVEEVDLPTEDQNDTINDLRDKCAILLESFSKNQSRDRFTWQDIAQRLVLEGKGTTAEVGATREDFQRLLGELKNPGESDVVYLRVLKALEKHRR
ncbi:hypothetical protein JHK82_040863 [Glycine max]|nr:hypothetical protein JHK82_040863 [Glycine max]